MFFYLSKILFYLVMPIAWVLLFLFLAVFSRNRKRKQKFLVTGVCLFLFFTNPVIINEAMLLWEVPARPIHTLQEYELAVVLTGVTNLYRQPYDRVHLAKGADRIMHAMQLYQMGKVKKILISGGSGSILRQDLREADQLKKILLMGHVPEQDIIVENNSRNTYENAVFSAETIAKMGLTGKKVLLITSAFHMRRSAGCFEKQGIQFDTFSADFYTINRDRYTFDKIVVPQELPFYVWYVLLHELLGYVSYALVGYI